MAPEASLITEIISQAESYDGIRAGIVRLEDVLKGPSYQAARDTILAVSVWPSHHEI